MPINLIMPMGGAGTRFLNNGYDCPKPLLDLCGRPFFAHAMDSIRKHLELSTLTFVVLSDHIERFGIDKKILEYAPEAAIIALPKVLNGAVLTCREGAGTIKNSLPVVFCDCDLSFLCSPFYDFCKDWDAGTTGTLITFKSDLPRYSYIERDSAGYVKRTAEKEVLSREAICGAYAFKDSATFLHYSEAYLESCSYSEYYMSGVYNEIIKAGGLVRAFPTDSMLSFGTPDEYKKAEEVLSS